MAKRRPEDILPFHRPSKRLCGSLVHMQPGSISPAGGVNSPALVVLSGRQSKKRSYYFENRVEQTEEEEEEACLRRKITRAPLVLVERTCGCFSDRCSTNNAHTCSRTRSQEECTRSDTIIPKTSDHAENDTRTDDCSYNCFQFWRSPLPAVDLSLLEDTSTVTVSDAMET